MKIFRISTSISTIGIRCKLLQMEYINTKNSYKDIQIDIFYLKRVVVHGKELILNENFFKCLIIKNITY